MADCGANGTTLDRAARAVMGSSTASQSNATKQLGNLLGHASLAAAQQQGLAAMPMNAPDRLVLPTVPSVAGGRVSSPQSDAASIVAATRQSATAMNPAIVRPPLPSTMDAVWNAPAISPGLSMPHHGLQHQQLHTPLVPHHQQAAMHLMMQQQQQFNMMVQQQQLQQQSILLVQKQKEIRRQQNSIQYDAAASTTQTQASSSEINVSQELPIELDHEGIVKGASIEELAAAWAEVQVDDDVATVGHEGALEGASMEELATAWAQAEAEYEELARQQAELSPEDYLDEDPSNLWSGDVPDVDATSTIPYEFVNTERPSEMLDWMGEGMTFFREGNLKRAIHAFEMELQHKNPDNSMAWRMLGRCHAENDQDPEAIRCLEAAVDRDPYSPDALLALGVSYVNELQHHRALENLKAWFTNNPKYAGMELPQLTPDIYGAAGETRSGAGESAFEEVKRLLLSALAIDATDAGDIHEALGVIYNVNKDYEAAAASLRKAIEARPNDYQLWNKLGATLANGNHSDQALPAYHKALQLKPKYARAWLNMAISHSNLQNHEEAARCYLQTLSLNPAATHCWSYLRMALSCSEKWDLLPLVFNRDVKPFREHYDFVMYDSF